MKVDLTHLKNVSIAAIEKTGATQHHMLCFGVETWSTLNEYVCETCKM